MRDSSICRSRQNVKAKSFSGDDSPGKHESSFDQWVFEVKTMQRTYFEAQINEAIVGFLKRSAASLVRYLGPEVENIGQVTNGVWYCH